MPKQEPALSSVSIAHPLMTSNPTPCVLHVDDDPSDTLLMEQACRKAGVSFQLRSVADGEAAIAYLSGEGIYADRERHPLPALVLLDLKMPRKTGFDVLKWIRVRSTYKPLPVVIF